MAIGSCLSGQHSERGNSLETGFFGFFFFFSGSCCFLSSPASVLCVLLLSLAVGSSVSFVVMVLAVSLAFICRQVH